MVPAQNPAPAERLRAATLPSPERNQFGNPALVYPMAMSQQLGTWLQALGHFEDAADEYNRATRMHHTWVFISSPHGI